jgi:hypothetical protein
LSTSLGSRKRQRSGACASGGTSQAGSLCFAELAAFGIVLELLIEKEELLSGSEDKFIPTVRALQDAVGEFHSAFSHDWDKAETPPEVYPA